MKSYKIAPSILSADYANFESELKKLEATGAEYAHIDICSQYQLLCGCGCEHATTQ